MDRDPVRFVWRAAPGPNLLALALAGAALAVAWLGLDLIASAVDDVILGRGFRDGAAPFLRLSVALPERIRAEPISILPGWHLDRRSFGLAVLGGLLVVALLAAALAGAALLLRHRVGARATAQARLALVRVVTRARASAREDARAAAALAGENLPREARALGGVWLVPVLAAAALALLLLRALALDWRLAAAGAGALLLLALVAPLRLAALERLARREAAVGAQAFRSVREVVDRLPAVAAHGTGRAERRRIVGDLGRSTALTGAAQRAAAVAGGAALLAWLLGPAILLAAAGWPAPRDGTTAGGAVALVVAYMGAALATQALVRWRRDRARLRGFLEEIARALGRVRARTRRRESEVADLPRTGMLEAERLEAADPATAARLARLSLSLALPAHVALTGERGPALLFAALLGGARDPGAGRLSLGGVDLGGVEAHSRSRRIAYAAGSAILLPGSLRDNLLYGDGGDPSAPDTEQRLLEGIGTAGLATFVYERGLSGRIDPEREPKLASDIVAARRAMRRALEAERLSDLVEPFDPARYNSQATVGENILFGVPLGDTFRADKLPGHPFVRAVLEGEGLDRPLAAMGLAIARGTVEIFADLPDGHPLFERFSFYRSDERVFFEELVARDGETRRGPEGARDRERIVSLALRYCETRHRLGLLDAGREARLLAARRSFATLLPASLRPAIEFYDPDRICMAASLADNLLFGRVAEDRAGAEAAILRVARRVLSERDLTRDVIRVGLDAPLDEGEGEVRPGERGLIDLVRCLVRRPDILVVGHSLERSAATEALVARLRRALEGRSLFLVLPDEALGAEDRPYDAVVRFERGGATLPAGSPAAVPASV